MNGTIEGFGSSLRFTYLENSAISDLQCTKSISTAISLGSGSTGNSIKDCFVKSSGYAGILFSQGCNGNSLKGCTISDADEFGIFFGSSISPCIGNHIVDCTITGSGVGIRIDASRGNTVKNCTITESGTRGILLNGSFGSCYYNRVEGNHISGFTGTSPTYGIYSVIVTRNLIIKNSCSGADTNFRFSSADTYGPEITLSGAITSTNPWANFSR